MSPLELLLIGVNIGLGFGLAIQAAAAWGPKWLRKALFQ